MALFHFRRDEGQGPGDQLIDRTAITLLGITFAFSRYTQPQAAPSGAAIGVLTSAWIFTARRALGFGTVETWVPLQSLEVKLGAWPPIASEQGSIELRPPLTVPANEACRIRVSNRNAAPAKVEVTVYERSAEGVEMTLAIDEMVIWPHEETTTSLKVFGSPAYGYPWNVTRIAYQSIPMGDAHPARIHGRPEWL